MKQAAARKVVVLFHVILNIDIQTYNLSHGYNRKQSAFKIIVDFNQTLLTQIQL